MAEEVKKEELKKEIEVAFGQDQQIVLVATKDKKECVLRIPFTMTYAEAYSCTREILITIKKLHEEQQKQLAEQKKAADQMKTSDVPESVES